MSSRSLILDWDSWVALPAYMVFSLMLVLPMGPALFCLKVFCLLILATVGAVVLTSGELVLRPDVSVWTLSGGDAPIWFALREILFFALIARELRICRP
jgi:hypothetical protein